MSDTDTGKTREFDGDFDEEKAKRLIQNLDAEIADLKTNLTEARSQVDEFRTAAEKAGEDRDTALAAATERAEKAERTLAIQKHGLPEDVVKEFSDYLTGTPDEVDAKAAKLAARLKIEPPKDESSDDSEGKESTDSEGSTEGSTEEQEQPGEQQPPSRPRPRLTPGHGETEGGKPFDAKAVAAKIRG